MEHIDFLKELKFRIRRTFLQLKETDIAWKKTIIKDDCIMVHYLLPYRQSVEVFEYLLDESTSKDMDLIEKVNEALISEIRESLEYMQLTIREALCELDKVK